MNKEQVECVVRLLENLESGVHDAYWRVGGSDCGSDYRRDACKPCCHYDLCTRHHEFVIGIWYLRSSVAV